MSCVSSSAKRIAVNGARMVPAENRSHADQRPESRALVRQEHRFDAAQRRPHHQQRREHAARSSRAQRDDPDRRFHQQHAGDHRARHVALQQRLDGVVANAQRLREDHAAQSDHHAADRRPPHPVDRQFLETHLPPRRRRASAGDERPPASSPAMTHPARPCGPMKMACCGTGNERTEPENVAARRARRGAGQRHGDRAARLPFEKQQFHGEQHRRDRRGECRRHARRRARHQQRLAFRRGQMK